MFQLKVVAFIGFAHVLAGHSPRSKHMQFPNTTGVVSVGPTSGFIRVGGEPPPIIFIRLPVRINFYNSHHGVMEKMVCMFYCCFSITNIRKSRRAIKRTMIRCNYFCKHKKYYQNDIPIIQYIHFIFLFLFIEFINNKKTQKKKKRKRLDKEGIYTTGISRKKNIHIQYLFCFFFVTNIHIYIYKQKNNLYFFVLISQFISSVVV